jgi:hypothetical protein
MVAIVGSALLVALVVGVRLMVGEWLPLSTVEKALALIFSFISLIAVSRNVWGMLSFLVLSVAALLITEGTVWSIAFLVIATGVALVERWRP